MTDVARRGDKALAAFRTIGEVASRTGIAPHVLRYWETRFAQLRPLQRGGGRRYYRPDDIALVERIDALLNRDGYTIRGVQRLLAREGGSPVPEPDALTAIRDRLAKALGDDAGSSK